MSDLIGRSAVLDLMRTNWADNDGDTAMQLSIDDVRNMPAAPKPRWIPVSERLPEPMGWDESYLVSLAWGGVGVMEYKSTGFHNYGSFSPVPIGSVIAWRPLPAPYKAEGSEKE